MITFSFLLALAAFIGVLVLAVIIDNEIKRMK